MTTQIKVPVLPESVSDATVAQWYKKPGDSVKRDENLVDLETDKVMLEVPAPHDGVLEDILKPEGSTVLAEEIIATLKEGAVASEAPPAQPEQTPEVVSSAQPTGAQPTDLSPAYLSPAVRRLVAERDLDVAQIKGSGKGGRVVKEDVLKLAEPSELSAADVGVSNTGGRLEKRVPMSRLRARVAERLMAVQRETAMLTTFNEVNMQAVMNLRSKYKESFEKQHGVRLGFMSFFVKAAVEALKKFSGVNASIEGSDVVYHGYYDVGIAVSTPRGLVVPVVRDVDMLSMAEVEQTILDYANKAKNNKLSIEEMTGGTFTITNGGVFGSMLSTPILNPPQSAILGMHNIVKRPVVENDEVVIRPMMYLALSYDHRIVDGRESVTFLRMIKESLEDPARLILGL